MNFKSSNAHGAMSATAVFQALLRSVGGVYTVAGDGPTTRLVLDKRNGFNVPGQGQARADLEEVMAVVRASGVVRRG